MNDGVYWIPTFTWPAFDWVPVSCAFNRTVSLLDSQCVMLNEVVTNERSYLIGGNVQTLFEKGG